MDIVDEKLDPTGQVFSVLGHIANNPLELLGNRVYLSSADFVKPFHQVVFNAIRNLAIDSKSDVKDITPLAVDIYLQSFPKYYSIWNSNEGVQYLTDAKNSQGQFSFEHDYSLLKKFSTLRKYYNQGIDIRDIYDYETSDLNKLNEYTQNIENMEVSDIVEHYTNKVINIRDDINQEDDTVVKFSAEDGIDTLLERLNVKPVMGYPFINGYYNTLFRGMQGGRFMLRSAASGGSKTRSAIRDLANISFSERYEKGKGWVKAGANHPTLFISTELNKDELQTILLAYVSGLTTSQIESGEFSAFEKQRLQHAVEVIQKSNMYFVYVEDFSTIDIQMIIEEYVVRYNIGFVVFDYIQNSPKLSKSFQDSYGHSLREDEILIELSRALKNMSEKYNIFIMSSTQLNSMADDDNIRVARTGRALRGGSATINKADYGVIMAKPTASDIKKLSPILKDESGMFTVEPNFAHFIFKNRSGNSDVILWTYYDMGNMRERPLFITDYNYNLINDIPITNVTEEEEDSSQKEIDF